VELLEESPSLNCAGKTYVGIRGYSCWDVFGLYSKIWTMKRLRQLNYNKNLGIRLGLERMSALASYLGVFDNNVKFVHVAGTNGKGSVCHKTAYAIQHDLGFRVGLFTSPHITTFRERIRIDQHMISSDRADDLAKTIADAASKIKVEPTYFESLTMMAFLDFHLNRVDYAVIEAGLGGATDATNIIEKPVVAAISSVALDH